MSVPPTLPILWTPSAVRQALAARIHAVTQIPEADQIHGVSGLPAQLAQRAFAVRWEGGENGTLPARTSTVVEVMHAFAVDLIRAASPHAGTGVWDDALDDEGAVRRALLMSCPDQLRAVEHRIRWLSTDPPTLDGGGGYRRSAMHFRIAVYEPLE